VTIKIGILHDFGGGDERDATLRRGMQSVIAQGRLEDDVEFVHAGGTGLAVPGGTAQAVERGFAELDAAGVLAIVGPAITDNTFVAQPLCDRHGIVAINYAGAEASRSEWMFHFQLGSLEDEPAVLARHLARRGLTRLAVLHDTSYIGRRKAAFLDEACPVAGTSIIARAVVSPVVADVREEVRLLERVEPEALVYLGMWTPARAAAVAIEAIGWQVPVVANSALIYGYADPEWRAGWENWVYCDTVADDNPVYAALRAESGDDPGPILAAFHDIGRLLGEGIARAPVRTREGVKEGLERVKWLPAATGMAGTLMGFGCWERGALKGDFLVPRMWSGGESVQWRMP
jgi:branched-chain amino acid transport system substrate-binding protein